MSKAIKVGFLFDHANDWISQELTDLKWLPVFNTQFEYIESFELADVTGMDLLFILGYTKILPAQCLDSNGLNLVVHESALPLGRGFSPVQWQIIERVNEIPVSLIEAVNPVDSGEIYGITVMKLEGHELLPEIRKVQADATKKIIISFLSMYPNFSKIPQSGNATYYRRRSREDDRLDPDKTIREQFNQLRIADNDLYPAYFEINGVKYLLHITRA